jgi:endonuclease G
MGGSASASWKPNPDLKESEQINIWSGSYGVEDYSRGHLLPDASRDGNSEMLKQAYYATNQVPQIQNSFNGGIWSTLENAVRSEVKGDTLYVVTGVAFKKVGGSENIKYIQPKKDTKQCPVPNYFYKVIMKVKRSGSTITSASTIGFWFEHKKYSDSYSNYAVSVDQIELWTGMDYFVNLPDAVENSAESNANWTTFQNF